MTGTAFVPPSAAPGTIAVDLTCRNGATATTTLTIVGSNALPSTATMGRHTGGGFLATGGRGTWSGALWIVGGLAAIGAATAVGTTTRRRRRAVGIRTRRR